MILWTPDSVLPRQPDDVESGATGDGPAEVIPEQAAGEAAAFPLASLAFFPSTCC